MHVLWFFPKARLWAIPRIIALSTLKKKIKGMDGDGLIPNAGWAWQNLSVWGEIMGERIE
jgi:hypothetical protein